MFPTSAEIVATLRKHLESFSTFDKREEFLTILEKAEDSFSTHLNDDSEPKVIRCINLEGIDGVGKTTLADFLAKRPGFGLVKPIPDGLRPFRRHFDEQEENIKRNYYNLCNIINSIHFLTSVDSTIWVIDRYWPSTIVYKLAHQNQIDLSSIPDPLRWPNYLARPSHVFYLYLDEQKRSERIKKRHEYEPLVPEEEKIASDQQFRERLDNIYRRIENISPLDADGTTEQIAEQILHRFETS